MPTQPDRPTGALEWLGNAAMYERQRCLAVDRAEQLEAEGKTAEARKERDYAEHCRRERNRDQAVMVRRQLNRSMNARRRY